MNTLFRKLAIWLLDWLRLKVDPELQNEIDEYQAKAKAQDELIKQTERQISENRGSLLALETERNQVAAEAALTSLKIDQIKKKLEELNREEIDLSHISDSDILRRKL